MVTSTNIIVDKGTDDEEDLDVGLLLPSYFPAAADIQWKSQVASWHTLFTSFWKRLITSRYCWLNFTSLLSLMDLSIINYEITRRYSIILAMNYVFFY